ncbi:MAG: NIPSNAP family protein [Verrucomicrobiota bacterium]
MKRPDFLCSMSLFATLLFTMTGKVRLAAAESGQPQYFELRVYSTRSTEEQTLIRDYWQKAAVPAYNRLGVSAVGVFTELQDSPSNRIFVVIPFETPGAYATVPARLVADAAYQAAAADYLNTPKSAPAYTRFESSMLVAFDGMKRLAVPAAVVEKKPWIYELRIYESHSESKSDNKVKMFNSGEIPLMQEVGLTPVFFGQTLVGTQMPNLIYMVSGENQDEHKKHWKDFFDAPVWKTLIGDPQYKDNVSKVISIFLKRTSASQI